MSLRFVRRAGLSSIIAIGLYLAATSGALQGQGTPAKQTPGQSEVAATSASRPGILTRDGQNAKVYCLAFRFEFHTADQCAAAALKVNELGAYKVSAFSKYLLVLIKEGDRQTLDKLLKLDGRRWHEREEDIELPPPPPHRPLDPATPQLRASEPIVRGGIDVGGTRYTGKGVVIAVIDSGCDFRHKDFIVDGPNGKTSRFLYLWDTYSDEFDKHQRGSAPPIDFKYPNGASVGTLYTNEQLNAELRSNGMTIPNPDPNGHGTGCAGIAAGNGRSIPVSGQQYGKYAGVAPEADLIGIRIGDRKPPEGLGLQNSYLLGLACEFAQKVAGDRPLVVTCSFGGQYGGRDGYRIEEREIAERFPLDKKPHAICIAAGNEREEGLHSRVSIAPGESREVSWVLDPEFPSRDHFEKENKPSGATLELYVDGISNASQLVVGHDKVNRKRNDLSNSYVFKFQGTPAGSVKLTNAASDPIVVDAYIKTDVPEGQVGLVRFAPGSVSVQNLTASPGSADSAITVASYDFNNEFDWVGRNKFVPVFPYGITGQAPPMRVGMLSAYSNPGPLRKGGNKPEVSAPGQWHIAPAIEFEKARFARELENGRFSYYHMIDQSGHYKIFSGTSAATPYAAGVVALMFEKNKKLTLGEVKQLLKDKATKVGAGWDKEYGYGKLDINAVTAIMNAIQ